MRKNNTKKWYRKRANPILILTLAGVLIGGCVYTYQTVLDNEQQQSSIEIVPGEFPKKETVAEPEKIVEVEDAQADETETAASPTNSYPVTLGTAEAASLTVVVNKKHRLPENYIPAVIAVRGTMLRSEAAGALEELMTAAEASGYAVKTISGYRSYATQVSVYNGYVAQNGQATADTFSARPGHSEHQTGLAVDVGNTNGSCDLEICFGSTAFGEWLKTNAQKYGFIIRYPSGKEAITGYQYEPWHLRFVGVDAAEAVVSSGKTLDEFYGVPAGGY